MRKKPRIRKVWSHQHKYPLESLSLSGTSGDTVVCDRKETIILFDRNGKIVWSEDVDFAPLQVCLTDDGQSIFVLTYDGYLMRITRDFMLEWSIWVTKDASQLAIKSMGQKAVVASFKGRFHVFNHEGERGRIVHTPEPVAHIKISDRTGQLFVASATGWVGLYDYKFNPVGEYNLQRPIAEVEVSCRGKKIFLPARDEGLHVIELGEDNLLTFNPGFAVSNTGIGEDGEKIVVVGLDGAMALMDINGNMLWETVTRNSWTLCEMSRAHDRFVTVSDEGLVVCYEILETVDNTKNDFDFLEIKKEKEDDRTCDGFDYLEV